MDFWKYCGKIEGFSSRNLVLNNINIVYVCWNRNLTVGQCASVLEKQKRRVDHNSKNKVMKKHLELDFEESAFLLVLLCEEETINKRMEELGHNMENVDLYKLKEKVRRLSWEFHWDHQKLTSENG